MSPTTIDQREIPGGPSSAVVRNYSLGAIVEMEVDFRAALSQDPPFAVGVSIRLAPVGPSIHTLALATQDQVFCLSFQQPPSPSHKETLRKLLNVQNVQYLTGFELPYTITLLAHTLGSDISGYDLSTLKSENITTPGDFLHWKNASISPRRINELWDGVVLGRSDASSTGTPEPNYALRAWFTAIASKMAIQDLPLGQRLSTQFIDTDMVRAHAELASRAIRRDLLKPRIQENDFSAVETELDGTMTVLNARFKTRIRTSSQTRLEVYLENGDVVDATIKGAKGRQSSARTERQLRGGDVARIQVIGREERTNSEQAQYHFLRSSHTDTRRAPSFVTAIWFPTNAKEIESHDEGIHSLSDHESQTLEKLNDSQKEVVGAMLSLASQDSLVIAHGPPGTGKTTTIAAAAAIWVSRGQSCWIIAQSNVGVKNIAEKMFEKEVDFRLIVSQEFYFEWHEKLYEEIEAKVIRSDELPDSGSEVSKTFGGATVVLCTLSMLSNPKLADCGLFDIFPVKSLVIDEASQIDVFEFMHLFYKFSKELTKVCFIGDPKQLPPYGSGEAGLETIFDIKHLKKKGYFLDTQYRLPIPLGSFISENVYKGKLRSQHDIGDYSCIAFIDVSKGEEESQGSSWLNMEEVHMVVRVARRYQQHGLNFCIITFYDPQRAAIIKALETADLPSERVHNVDSFQGNEADYVILSSVRTKQPGFLKSQPRMNVALTRCRKGMVVVTNKYFLQGAGKSMLIGQLCHAWSRRHDTCWVDWNAMLNNSAALPGLPRPLPPSPASSTRQQLPPLMRNNERSRPSPSASPNPSPLRHTTTLPLVPPSKPQTQTRTHTLTHQASMPTLTARPAPRIANAIKPRPRSAIITATDAASPAVLNAWGHPSSSTSIAATAVPRELGDAFPPLGSATPSDRSSRNQSPKRR